MTFDLTLALGFDNSRSTSPPETTATWEEGGRKEIQKYEHSLYHHQDLNYNYINSKLFAVVDNITLLNVWVRLWML